MDWLIIFHFLLQMDNTVLVHVIHSPSFDTLQACTEFMRQEWPTLSQYIGDIYPQQELMEARCDQRQHLQQYYPELFRPNNI